MNKKIWLLYALITTVTWGMWGAFSKSPIDSGFPYTLVYAVWALTMIVPGIVILWIHKWKIQHDKKSILYGLIIGFLGAGGQLLLFQALKTGPAYLIFPIISISPAVTIVLSFFLLKERTGTLGIIGIILALLFPAGGPYFAWLGQIFISVLKLLILPLILVSIYASLAVGDDLRRRRTGHTPRRRRPW